MTGNAKRTVLTVCVILATVMQSLDGTIANVAVPYMQGSLNVSQEQINWVLTSYLVAAAIMTAPTAFLAARFGRTRLFVIAVLGFTATSVLCGIADSLAEIVVFRFMQGMCGAALMPLSQAVMFDIYTVEERPSAMALWSMGATLGPICGPIVGGWLTGSYNWRWVFYINVPFGLLAAVGFVLFLKETSHSKAVKLDWVGFVALSLAIGALQALLDRGETLDWFTSHEIIIETCFAGLSFYIFLVQFSLAPKPFLSPRLFSDTNFVIGIVLMFIIGVNMYATLALLAPYLQELMNYPVLTAGFILAPRGVGVILATFVTGRLMRKINVRYLLGFGMAANAYALYEMMLLTPDVSEQMLINIGLIQGLGIGFVVVTLAVTTFATLPVELRTEGTGIFALMRQLGSAIGIAITGAVLQATTETNHAEIASEITPFNRALQNATVSHFWNPASTHGASVLNAEINRQASIIGYSDDFKLMLFLSVGALPLVMLVRAAAAAKLDLSKTSTS